MRLARAVSLAEIAASAMLDPEPRGVRGVRGEVLRDDTWLRAAAAAAATDDGEAPRLLRRAEPWRLCDGVLKGDVLQLCGGN